jgi:transcriptional regulator GlxA family with amidase domain
MTKFVFLVLPKIHLMDLAGPDQVILESIGYGADFSIEYCSIDKNVVSSAGLPIEKTKHYTEIVFQNGDYLIIPGSNVSYLISPEFKQQKALFTWLKTIYQQGVNVCSVCAGAFVLAQSGLLNGVPCTTHFKRTKQLQELFPQLKVMDNILFTEHKGIYTSAGIAAGIDLALHIVEQLKGKYFAHKVAREMVIYNRRNGNQQQESDLMSFRNHIHSGIHNVQDWLQENLDKPANISDLAALANMSDRNFTRIFKKETSLTVHDYITLLRKERITELLKNPDLSRRQIAQKCGLTSERQLSRLINEKY